MKELKILIFKLNGEYFATDIMEVERILPEIEPSKVPDAPDFMQGVIKYEQEVIPVLNLYKRFKIKSLNDCDNKKIIVIKKEQGKFGIIVDDVDEVITIQEDIIDNPTAMSTIVSKRYIRGIIKEEKKLIILLDLNNILLANEEEAIFEGIE